MAFMHSYHHTLLEQPEHQHRPAVPEVLLGGFHGYSTRLGEEILSSTTERRQ